MTAEVVFIAPSLSRGRRQSQKEEYAYAFLRLEEACAGLASYRSRAIRCEPFLSRVAMKLFCKESAQLVELTRGVAGEAWMRRTLYLMQSRAYEIEQCLAAFDRLPVERSPAADGLAGRICLNLSDMRRALRPILPDHSPYYRDPPDDSIAENQRPAL